LVCGKAGYWAAAMVVPRVWPSDVPTAASKVYKLAAVKAETKDGQRAVTKDATKAALKAASWEAH